LKEALTVIGIIVIAIILGSAIWYTHNNGPRSTPIPTPTITPTTAPTSTPIPTRMPTATVTAKIIVTARGGLLLVNGTVTNNGPNTAYNWDCT